MKQTLYQPSHRGRIRTILMNILSLGNKTSNIQTCLLFFKSIRGLMQINIENGNPYEQPKCLKNNLKYLCPVKFKIASHCGLKLIGKTTLHKHPPSKVTKNLRLEFFSTFSENQNSWKLCLSYRWLSKPLGKTLSMKSLGHCFEDICHPLLQYSKAVVSLEKEHSCRA